MTRSVWKGPFVHPSLLKKIDKLKDTPNKKPIKTWSRNSTIIPDFVGHSFMIHNGKSFIPITVSEEMVGHKLGEFAPTRTFKGHTPADKKAAAPAAAPMSNAGEKTPPKKPNPSDIDVANILAIKIKTAAKNKVSELDKSIMVLVPKPITSGT